MGLGLRLIEPSQTAFSLVNMMCTTCGMPWRRGNNSSFVESSPAKGRQGGIECTYGMPPSFVRLWGVGGSRTGGDTPPG